eukprot:CAMPEP_0180371982 /NCGR_PEP_ID=MMETSP0989-20121125/20214_1 /TAXON_ID=697907 /ORGANISM="non described non described, Strain CCMP2293" /LENGTH=44 /DNA_ID= /DNA_START= /DNA_END= /DNA_ORIENTATION=
MKWSSLATPSSRKRDRPSGWPASGWRKATAYDPEGALGACAPSV